jgi:nucleobase:cation symporter-1, NCS1 family
MSPSGFYHYDGGWSRRTLVSLALSAGLSIGLALAGAYGLIIDTGDWGWLIGALSGAAIYSVMAGLLAKPKEAGAAA